MRFATARTSTSCRSDYAIEKRGRRPVPQGARLAGQFLVKASGHDADFGMAFQHVELAGELVRLPGIVGVEKREQIAAGAIEAVIAGAGGAAVRLPNQRYALSIGFQ